MINQAIIVIIVYGNSFRDEAFSLARLIIYHLYLIKQTLQICFDYCDTISYYFQNFDKPTDSKTLQRLNSNKQLTVTF